MTLFDDIAGSKSKPSLERRSVRDEIKSHLQQMASGRLGALLLAPDYGVGDVRQLEHAFPGTVDVWRAQYRETIRRYEERLRNPEVLVSPNMDRDFTLGGEIRGLVSTFGRTERISFAFAIDLQGRLVMK